jgi:three-Cys-motif partner protein
LTNHLTLDHKVFLTNFSNDGFGLTAAEPWFKVKVQVLQTYLQTFITHSLPRADDLIFVDLFAGSGLYCHGHQKDIFPSCSLASMAMDWPFSKWILCERNPEEVKALKIRVNKNFRNKNVVLLDHPLDELVEKLKLYVPQSKGGYRASTLCLVDPFSFEIHFSLIQKLADLGFNFLIPFTFNLNSRHDHKFYLEEQSEKLKKYAGTKDLGRLQGVQSNVQFYKHLVRTVQNNMLMLGLNTSLTMHRMDSSIMDLPAYYIGFFSRQISAKAIQREIRDTRHEQLQLF